MVDLVLLRGLERCLDPDAKESRGCSGGPGGFPKFLIKRKAAHGLEDCRGLGGYVWLSRASHRLL